jgi:phospholipase/carboxylesterase
MTNKVVASQRIANHRAEVTTIRQFQSQAAGSQPVVRTDPQPPGTAHTNFSHMFPSINRAGAGRVTVALALVSLASSLGASQGVSARNGRLTARPRTVTTAMAPGFSTLAIGRDRDGLLYVPPAAKAGPVPLMVMLHGAGGSRDGIQRRFFGTADTLDFAMLVPDSRGPTWDAIRGDYGSDIAFIDSALKLVFARVAIDPARVIVAGFSDGASYALALGRINGDLFSRVLAFSPGFIPPGSATGKPEIFITHGDADRILPFESTSQRIEPALRRAGYVVTLRKFVGGHTVPADLAREGFRWAIAPRETRPR